jgi:hypothetical protein
MGARVMIQPANAEFSATKPTNIEVAFLLATKNAHSPTSSAHQPTLLNGTTMRHRGRNVRWMVNDGMIIAVMKLGEPGASRLSSRQKTAARLRGMIIAFMPRTARVGDAAGVQAATIRGSPRALATVGLAA